MNTKRLQDQVLILSAIKVVKQELEREAADPDSNWLRQGEIVVRLATLYSLLDVDRLALLCVKLDERAGKEEEAA